MQSIFMRPLWACPRVCATRKRNAIHFHAVVTAESRTVI
jgi:hypothetical protein